MMSFGTLGATISAAVDNAKALLEAIKAMQATPDELKADIRTLLENAVKREASASVREETVAAREIAVTKREGELEVKQRAFDDHRSKFRKLME